VKRWALIFGPGLVFALSVIGPGDLVANSAAGATYGYALIWVLGLALIFRWTWLGASAKYVAVTGESLMQGYARLGHWLVWTILIATLLVGHLVNLYMIVFVGNAAHLLLPLPTSASATLWSLFFVAAGFALMFRHGYRGVERACKGLIAVLGASLIIAALRATPDPEAIVQGMLLPSLPFSDGLYSTILLLAAIIGTEAGSMSNLLYAYFIYEKGWTTLDSLRRQRMDLIFSITCVFVMGALMQIAAAGTLQEAGIELKTISDLGAVYAETQGRIGTIVFGLGFWAMAFTSFIGLTTGRALIVDDIFRRFIFSRDDKSSSESPASKSRTFRATVVFLSFSPLYILLIDIEPILLALVVSAIFLVAVPVLAYGLLRITNDRTLMGEYRNGWHTNIVIALLVIVAVYLSYRNGLDLFAKLKDLFVWG